MPTYKEYVAFTLSDYMSITDKTKPHLSFTTWWLREDRDCRIWTTTILAIVTETSTRILHKSPDEPVHMM